MNKSYSKICQTYKLKCRGFFVFFVAWEKYTICLTIWKTDMLKVPRNSVIFSKFPKSLSLNFNFIHKN